jgi:hypothetical protein
MSNCIVEKIQTYLEQNNFDSVPSLLFQLDDCEYVERVVHRVLENKNTTPNFLDLVLNHFLSTCENDKHSHETWVHSLSHFTKEIWVLGRHDWIKKFNEVAFKGAIELNAPSCSDRLVMDFLQYHRFDDDPNDFFLNSKNLAIMEWSNWRNPTELQKELESSPFESNEALLRFKLNCTLSCQEWVFEIQQRVADIRPFELLLNELLEIGVDITEFNPLKVELYTKRLQSLVDLRGKVREEYNEALELKIQEAEQQMAEIS